MAVQTITYDNKVALNENPSVADINKVTDDDMNEIKSVVNNNASETSTNTTNITTNTTKITNLQTYSTSETNTGKTWINNKPIYRKVIAFGSMPNNSLKTIAHGISNLGETIRLYGMAFKTDTKRSLTIPDPEPSAEITCNVTNTDIYITTHNDRSAFNDSFICIEYTKTTD